MARVDADGLKNIFDTDLGDTDLDVFIATASLVVDDELADKGLSVNRLTEIERYLAAHFAALKDPRMARSSDGDFSVTVQGTTAMGLESTHYGQTAMSLDSTGTLRSLGKKQTARIRVFGATDRCR